MRGEPIQSTHQLTERDGKTNTAIKKARARESAQTQDKKNLEKRTLRERLTGITTILPEALLTPDNVCSWTSQLAKKRAQRVLHL